MKLVVNSFRGIAPRYADRLLEDNQASFVANLKPTSGDLRGFRSLKMVEKFPGSTYRRAIKLYYPDSDLFVWFVNDDIDADVVQSPLATDSFNRVYYTDKFHANPQITTLDDIKFGVPPADLGVPRPTAAPSVSHSGGSGATDIRAYTYTYVDEYGASGAPSPPAVETGKVDDTWIITVGTVAIGTQFVDIYRSATGEASSGAYYKVARISSPFGPYTDTMAPSMVPLQLALVSYDYNEPPAGLQGLTLHSSGAMVGFLGRTVYFSQPYLPHAWPDQYRYVVASDIVGIAAISNQIVVLTQAYPVILTGSRPDTIAINALTDPEPCVSKRSIVTMNRSVYYASPNGLVGISNQGLSRPTNELMTRTEFEPYAVSQLFAAVYGSYYIGFYNINQGFAVALPPFEPVDFVPLDRYAAVTGLDTDRRSSDLYVTQSDITSKFDQTLDRRFATTWRSKEFITPYPVNFGAFQIIAKPELVEANEALLVEAANAYNTTRYAEGPLDRLGDYMLGGSIDQAFEDLDPELGGLPPIQPLGGEPLYEVGTIGGIDNTRFTLIADGIIRYSGVVGDQKIHRLPEGYRATRYYLEVSGSASVNRIVVAQTGRECKTA